ILLAMIVATAVGLVVGFLASRVGSVAVFLVTFACAEALFLLVLTDPRGLTAGDNGLSGVVPAPFLGFRFNHQMSVYYVALGVLLVTYRALLAVTRTPFGLVLQGIRENELRIRFAGYHVEQYKTAAFGISALVAGLAGALNAIHERVAAPESLGWAVSGDAVRYATLGGRVTRFGPPLGAGPGPLA